MQQGASFYKQCQYSACTCGTALYKVPNAGPETRPPLQADEAAEQHLERHSPVLVGRQAVVNRGPMTLSGFGVSADVRSKLDALADELW